MAITVLIVDDDNVVSMTLVRQLSSVGYATKTAATGAEALKLAAREPFAAIFVDYHLPDNNGVRLMGQLRQLQARAQLVMTTGWSENAVRSELQQARLADCQILPKPWAFNQVLAIVATAARASEPPVIR
jgi:two-component system, NtrC family, response regulator HydG